jgi:hypothetical protein
VRYGTRRRTADVRNGHADFPAVVHVSRRWLAGRIERWACKPAMGDGRGCGAGAKGKIFWRDRRCQKKNLPRERRWQAEQGTSSRPRRGALGGWGAEDGRGEAVWVEVKKDEGLGGAVVRKMGVV